MRKFLSVAFGAAVALGAAPALAQETFGVEGDAVFSADRLFGFHWTKSTTEVDGPVDDIEVETNGVALGWRGRQQPSPFDTPRLAFDYFIIDSLSLGGSIGYASYGDDADFSEFIFSPRVGYVIMFNDVFGFWPRGGFTYHSASFGDDDDDVSENGFAFTAEAMFLATPSDHFGFIFGPTFDIDLTGEREAGNAEADHTYRSFGIQVGLFGWI